MTFSKIALADCFGVPEILDPDGLSNGGNGLLIFNVEMRNSLATLGGRAPA